MMNSMGVSAVSFRTVPLIQTARTARTERASCSGFTKPDNAPVNRMNVKLRMRPSVEGIVGISLNHTKWRSRKPTNPGRRGYQNTVASSSAEPSNPSPSNSASNPLVKIGAAVGMLLMAATVAVQVTSGVGFGALTWQNLISLKAGFISAFSIIFISELGDKTFFIAALLAMKRGKLPVLVGGVAALGVMTVISVALGVLCQKVPAVLSSSSLPIGEYLGAALLVYFGIRNIQDALDSTPSSEVKEGEDATGELASAEEFVETESSKSTTSVWGALVESFSLIFVAEWGDRSMLATIALGAAQNPVAVCAGATAGHAAATIIAVIGGSLLSKYISEKVVGLTGGILFLIFAAATLLGIF